MTEVETPGIAPGMFRGQRERGRFSDAMGMTFVVTDSGDPAPSSARVFADSSADIETLLFVLTGLDRDEPSAAWSLAWQTQRKVWRDWAEAQAVGILRGVAA